MKPTISVAYSPNTDDAFMVHAMQQGLIDLQGYSFTFRSADIQELNAAALDGVYDVTAISVAAYPGIADKYFMMPVGASIGDQFGPAIIVRKDAPFETAQDLAGRKIAVPGRQTSAFFAARALIGTFDDVPMLFSNIAEAVTSGACDAGILIHELQLDCEHKGFRRLGDLGRLWADRFHLPLPLGANAIRRGLGAEVISEVTDIMRSSILHGLTDRTATLKAALQSSGADIDLMEGDRYISMYVNERSLDFQEDVRTAVEMLLASGAAAGLCPPADPGVPMYCS